MPWHVVVHYCPLLSIVVHCCPSLSIVVNLRLDLPWSTLPLDWWYIVKIPCSLIYFECTGTGTDGTFTGTDDTGMSFDGTGTGNEGTDSTSTDAYDIGTILSHFHWWILRLSAIQKKSLTDLVNNIGVRDASASKNTGFSCLTAFLILGEVFSFSFPITKEFNFYSNISYSLHCQVPMNYCLTYWRGDT